MSGNEKDMMPSKEELDAFMKKHGIEKEQSKPITIPERNYQGIKKSGKQLRREKRKKEKRVKIYYKNTK